MKIIIFLIILLPALLHVATAQDHVIGYTGCKTYYTYAVDGEIDETGKFQKSVSSYNKTGMIIKCDYLNDDYSIDRSEGYIYNNDVLSEIIITHAAIEEWPEYSDTIHYTYVYDQKGNPITTEIIFGKSDRIKTINTYDANNRISSAAGNSSRNGEYNTTYEYNPEGVLMKAVTMYSDATETTIYENGRKKSKTYDDGDFPSNTRFFYDDKGNLIKEEIFQDFDEILELVINYEYF